MKCNTKCTLYHEGKSTAGITVGGKDIQHCVYRHSEMLKRGEYERVVMVSNDITSTYCYRDKRILKGGGGGSTRRRNPNSRRV